MRTDYQNINKFEVGIISVIAIGFVILGIVLFASLTPRVQTDIIAAFDMFDIHIEVIASIETIKFAYSIPNEFYEEFYIAFEQVATLPSESVEMPGAVLGQFYQIAFYAVSNLSDQVAEGFTAQSQFQLATAQHRQLAYDGKVMGAAILIADQLSKIVPREKTRSNQLDLYYSFPTNSYNLQITRMVERAEQVKGLR